MNLTINKFNYSNKTLFKGSDVNTQKSNKATTPIDSETKDSKVSNKKKMFAIGATAVTAAAIATIAIVNKKGRSGSDIVNDVKDELTKQEKNAIDIKNKVSSTNVDKNISKPAETIPVAIQKEVSKENLLEKSMVVAGTTSVAVATATENESKENGENKNSISSKDSFKSLEDNVKTKTSNKKSRSDKKNEVLLNAIALDMERKAEEENRYEYKNSVSDSKNIDAQNNTSLCSSNSEQKASIHKVNQAILGFQDFVTTLSGPHSDIDTDTEIEVKTKEEVKAFPSQNDSSQDDFDKVMEEVYQTLADNQKLIGNLLDPYEDTGAEANRFFDPHNDIDTDTEIDEFTDSDVDFSDVDFDFINAYGHNGNNHDDYDDNYDYDDYDNNYASHDDDDDDDDYYDIDDM